MQEQSRQRLNVTEDRMVAAALRRLWREGIRAYSRGSVIYLDEYDVQVYGLTYIEGLVYGRDSD